MNPSIKILPFPGIDNAYVIISGRKKKDEINISQLQTKINVSFFRGDDKGGCEWDGEYGPFTLITPCDKDGKNCRSKAVKHWFYDYSVSDFSQLYVDESGIKDHFLMGDYEGMFDIMRRFTINNRQ